jgi:antitoxin (DNA-binding transcriptional repressor) of toxin-antitoxin stability system
MKRIGAAKFKEQCLSLLDHLEPEGLIITKRGKPVARVIPFPRSPAQMIGSLRNKIEIHGDILSTGVSWDADRQS